jgi:hypothetical protein
MSDETILFVLGAGASAPFGFPTGADLRDSIIAGLESSDASLRRNLLELGYEDGQVDDFRDRFQRSTVGTIDQFLEHNVDHLSIGRSAMAVELVRREDASRLFEKVRGNWYALLAQQVFGQRSHLENSRVGFVTFNYDRSLEHFLFTSLKYRYDLDEDEAASFVNSMSIDHVYGKLGSLPWERPGPHEAPSNCFRQYSVQATLEEIANCASCLHLIHDSQAASKPLKHIAYHLGSYDAIHFLGFGYDPMNLKRIGITSNVIMKTLFGSAFGLGSQSIARIEEEFHIKLDSGRVPVYEYLQNVVGWG